MKAIAYSWDSPRSPEVGLQMGLITAVEQWWVCCMLLDLCPAGVAFINFSPAYAEMECACLTDSITRGTVVEFQTKECKVINPICTVDHTQGI